MYSCTSTVNTYYHSTCTVPVQLYVSLYDSSISPHHCQPFSYHFQHARAAARPFMHRYVIFSQNAPSSQPAMRALAGWPIACIHPASQPRACIMHEDSGCTQIRSCTVCMPNLGGPRSLVATCTHQGLIRDEALRSILVTCSTIISPIYNEIKCAHAELVLHSS